MHKTVDLFDHIRGATAEEAELALDIPHKTTSGRFTELRRWGYIDYLFDAHGGQVERNTLSGNGAKVHVVTPHGIMAVKLNLVIRSQNDPTAGKHGGVDTSERAFRQSNFTSLRMTILRFIHSKS